MIKLICKKLTDNAKLPFKKRSTDEGFDLHASEDIVLPVNIATKVSTGISAQAVEVTTKYEGVETVEVIDDKKYWLQIEGRSGMASKGVFPIGGIVDVGYTGEIGVLLVNLSGEEYTISEGDRISQLVIRDHKDAIVTEVDSLEGDRGSKGFGDSGK